MKVESRHLLQLPAAVRVKAYKSFYTNITLSKDPRISNFGRVIRDEYAVIKDSYGTQMKIMGCSHLNLTTNSNAATSNCSRTWLARFQRTLLSRAEFAWYTVLARHQRGPSHQRH